MLSVYRIVKAKRAATAFDGEGAFIHGGRWNSPGTRVVYAAASRSLAALEMLFHLDAGELLLSYVVFPVRLDESTVLYLDPADLPADWATIPNLSAARRIGDEWAAGGVSVALGVPSAVIPAEWNYLISPAHPDFDPRSIGPPEAFAFDPRLKA